MTAHTTRASIATVAALTCSLIGISGASTVAWLRQQGDNRTGDFRRVFIACVMPSGAKVLERHALHLRRLFRVPVRGLEFATKWHPRCGLQRALACSSVMSFQYDRDLKKAEQWHLRGTAAAVKPSGSGTTGVDAGVTISNSWPSASPPTFPVLRSHPGGPQVNPPSQQISLTCTLRSLR